jgi:hypothetical protein
VIVDGSNKKAFVAAHFVAVAPHAFKLIAAEIIMTNKESFKCALLHQNDMFVALAAQSAHRVRGRA